MEREKLISLVKGVQNGNEAAFTEMYEAFHNDIYYYIFKTVNDKELASDLTQDTFIEILQSIHSLQEPAAFVTWSRQIAFRRCTAYFKKRRDLIADEDEDGYSVFDTLEEDNAEFIPGEALDKEEFKNIILSILDTLPEEQRSAIMMRYFDEMSIPEIAKIQLTSEGTVKSRLNYGRKAIAKAVEDYEKKYDIKLHSMGVLPILLWVTRQQKLSRGISLTTGTASATGAAAAITAASAATAATTATATTASVLTAGVAVKAATTALAVKIAAGVVAAALTVGGIALAVNHSPSEEPDSEINKEQTEQEDTETEEDSKTNTEIGQNKEENTETDSEDNNTSNSIETCDHETDGFFVKEKDDDDETMVSGIKEIISEYIYMNQDGKYCRDNGEELDLLATPVKAICLNNTFCYWDADGNFYMDGKTAPIDIPKNASPLTTVTYTDNTEYFYYLHDGHIYINEYDSNGMPIEEKQNRRIYFFFSFDDSKFTDPEIIDCWIVDYYIIIKTEDGNSYYAYISNIVSDLHNGNNLYGFLPYAMENVDTVYGGQYDDFYIKTAVYSKTNDNSHLYFEYKRIKLFTALPKGYVTSDIKNIDFKWITDEFNNLNPSIMIVEFNDGSVYHLPKETLLNEYYNLESSKQTEASTAMQLVCHEKMTELGKCGHIQSIMIQYNGSWCVLMDDGCLYDVYMKLNS